MLIRRIEIAHFRKLLRKVVIDQLAPGITVIAGDNEEGKSTVLAALQAAFFDRHRLTGQAAEAMLPLGHAVRPEVAVDFEIDGGAFRLRKGFCQNPSAELVLPGGAKVTGDAVEERLQQLLRFAPPGRGPAQAEHRGVWGLFWVEQGTAFHALDLAGTARHTMVSALEQEVGTVLGGDRGRSLRDAISRRYKNSYTPTGRPRGAFKDAQTAAERARAEAAGLAERVASFDRKVDDLARLRERLAAYARDRSLERASEELARAEAAMAEVERLRRALAEAQERLRLAQARAEGPAARLAARSGAVQALVEAEQAAAGLRATLDGAVARHAGAERGAGTARAAHETARQALTAAEDTQQRALAAERRAQRASEAARLAQDLAQARAAKQAMDAASAAAAANPFDARLLQQLATLERTAATARARLEAAATRIDLQPSGAAGATLDGVAVPAGEPLQLARRASLDLAGWGRIVVTPGGAALGELTRAAEDADDALRRALSTVGARDMGEAQARGVQRERDASEQRAQTKVLATLAPTGIAALETASRAAEVERAGGGACADPPDPAAARAAAMAAGSALEAARAAEADARRARDAQEAEERGAREAAIAARASHEAKSQETDRHRAALDQARQAEPDAALEEAVGAAGREVARAREGATAAEVALRLADGATVEATLARCRDAHVAIAADIADRKRKAADIEIELRTLGQEGLGEQLQRAEADASRAQAEADRLARDAAAVALLHRVLGEAETAAKEAFLTPVRARIAPYLRLLFPDSELVLDESALAITHLRRDGQAEPFGSLSVGTREQLAVVARLAFAELLREQGRPAAVILDDALVYADETRLERMLLALRQAAQKVQIIVLTCRERDYEGLGAKLIRLRECGVG